MNEEKNQKIDLIDLSEIDSDKSKENTKKEAKKEIKKDSKRNKKCGMLWRVIAFSLSFMFIEFIFHIAVFGRVSGDIIYPLLFGIVLGCLLSLLTIIFKKIGNAIIAYIALTGYAVYAVAQIVYYKIFDTFLSLTSAQGAEDAMNFKQVMFDTIKGNIGYILALFIPLIAVILLNVFVVTFKRPNWKNNVAGLAALVLSFGIAMIAVCAGSHGTYSAYHLLFKKYVLELSMEKLGIATTTVRDGLKLAGVQDEKTNFALSEYEFDVATDTDAYATTTDATATDTDATATDATEVVYAPQIDENLKLSNLYYKTDDENLKNLTAYFSNKTPTYENEYTGMFEGYNVVYLTCESLCRYVVNEKWTPTLYKMMNEGFVFNNFYNPRWYHSTIDGEFVNCLSQYPSSTNWSFYKSSTTYQPYALGNILNEEGYTSKAYHDYDFYYYDRSKTHANMGYDFKAIDYGLDIPSVGAMYSDVDMVNFALDENEGTEKFNMYFMTFSGHLPYDFSMQPISVRNREECEELLEGTDYPDNVKAYIAAQMELDKALETLMDRLEEEGQLDNTLFIIAPDHYPYNLSEENFNALAGFDVSSDKFELHHSCLGIWNSQMTEPVEVDKLCASVDILPTVLNLMGVNYDSRLLAGHDILADSEELVIYADHSFLTDKIKYDAATGEVTYLCDQREAPDSYVQAMIQEVEDILTMSDDEITYDYFNYAYGDDSSENATDDGN